MKTRSGGRRHRADSPRPPRPPRPVEGLSNPAHRVLFLSTQTKRPLGADVWVLTQAIRSLDPERHDIHVWLSVDDGSGPTDTYRAIRDVPGLHIHPVDLSQVAAAGG